MVVVHIHDVADIGIEGEVVGAVRRFEKPVDVENHGDAVGMVVADKGVPVSYVRTVVECGDWRLAMAGCKQAGWNQHEQHHGEGHC